MVTPGGFLIHCWAHHSNGLSTDSVELFRLNKCGIRNDSERLSMTQSDSAWLETTWNDSEWPTFFFNRYIVFFAPNFLFQASMAHLQNLRARNQDGSDFWKGSVDLTMMSKYVQRMSKVCFWPNDSESKQPCPCRVRRWSSSGYFGNTWNSGTFAESCLLLRRFQLWKVEGVRNLVEFGVLICFIVLHCALFWVKMRQLRITKFLEYKAIASKFPFCRVWRFGKDLTDSRHLKRLGQMSEMRLSVRERVRVRLSVYSYLNKPWIRLEIAMQVCV